MLQAGPALKVSVHLNQDTGAPHGFLYQAILRFLDEKGIAGATVIRAHEGFGSHRRLHSKEAGDVAAEHLPVLIYFIDETAKVQAILPELLALVTDGLVEAHPTEILKVANTPEKVLA